MTTPPEPSNIIHYDPARVDYAVTPDELNRLSSGTSNLWREFCLVTLSLGLPCLINAIATTPDPFKLTLGLFLNYLFGVVGLLASGVLGIVWACTHKSQKALLDTIKQKPAHILDVRALQTRVGEIKSHPPNVLVAPAEKKS